MNDKKPKDITGYPPEQTDECERVLVTLLNGMGPWKDSVYLVGGLAPRYIAPADPERPHGGTNDVDIVVRMSVLADTKAYATLEENLARLGFTRVPLGNGGFFTWRWQVMTDKGHAVVLEFLTGDLEGGRRELEKMPVKGGKLNAYNFPVLHLVYHFFDKVEVTAELLNGRGVATETLRHASVVSYLCAKADALDDRGEEKDAHDIAYCLEGVQLEDMVAAFEKALKTEFGQMIRTELLVIKKRFCSDDKTEGYRKDGPVKAVIFELQAPEGDDEDTRNRRIVRQRMVSSAAEALIAKLGI